MKNKKRISLLSVLVSVTMIAQSMTIPVGAAVANEQPAAAAADAVETTEAEEEIVSGDTIVETMESVGTYDGAGTTDNELVETEELEQAQATGDKGTNVALLATADADYQNTPVTNVNDGALASASAATSWNTWDNDTYPTYVYLNWEDPYTLYSMGILYWADNGTLDASNNVTFPKSCNVEYYDNAANAWTPVTEMTDENGNEVSTVGVKYGTATEASTSTDATAYINGANAYWNTVEFKEPVMTTSVRIALDRNGSGSNGVGISEWQVYGDILTADSGKLVSASVSGTAKVAKDATVELTAAARPAGLSDLTYAWSIADDDQDILAIDGAADGEKVNVKGIGGGKGTVNLAVSHVEDGVTITRTASYEVTVEAITGIDRYATSTAEGTAPILPKMVVANGLTFDDPSEHYVTPYHNVDLYEEFNSKLVPVTWDAVDAADYAVGKAGSTFTVHGTVAYDGETYDAYADITVNTAVVVPVSNSTVTFENIQLTDEFWSPKQKTNAINSLNAGIYRIGLESGGEPNFTNAIAKLNGEPYSQFQGYVFQDSDIYKSIEAISYTLSATQNDNSAEMVEQREKLEATLEKWISYIEQVQYADGYIDTHFTLRANTHSGGNTNGLNRWRDFSNHEMYNAGHFFESVVAYTRYREGIGNPDYSLYVVGKRFADEIVTLFGPDGTRHEVPGHEEVELALVKLAKLVDEYEGEGAGDKYRETAKTFIDRRGEPASNRDSGYKGGEYSQDYTPIAEETNGVGHAVRACYFYAGVTDIATLLPEDDPDRAAYLNTMDNIWDSVTNRKSYITGGIGVSSHGEDFGGDYELPSDGSYCETCASIALANWNQRMNLIHEDAKYVDVVERTLYNSILAGTNLEGNLFYYNSLLEVKNGNPRSSWFGCACCPPNLMRTIAKLSEYMYTVHGNTLFVNLYIGSNGSINIGGDSVGISQKTEYPWDGAVKLTVNPSAAKEFTMKIRIPGWTQEQEDSDVTIQIGDEVYTNETAEKGYVTITRTWNPGDEVIIDMAMEVRKTEADPHVTTNDGKIALQRGPVVYCMEKAGNAQINNDSDFNPLNFVIPRDAELTAEYNPDLLNGVVEITGDVKYQDGDELVDAKLQAVPYYAWNNRGDDGVQGQNSSSKMLIWTDAIGGELSAQEQILNASIEIANNLDSTIYTEDSWKAVQDALDKANDVVEDENATDEQREAAAKELNDAIANLKSAASIAELEVAKNTMNKVVEVAEALDSTLYTEESYAPLAKAITDAKALGADAKTADYKTAANEITKAIQGLVVKTVEPAPTVAKVTGLKASAATNSVKLTWNKVDGATGYVIERAKGTSTTYTKLKTIKSGSTVSFTNKKLAKATGYKYRIYAYVTKNDATTDGAASSVVKALTKPAKVTGTTVKRTTKVSKSSKATLKFKKVSGATRYEIRKYNKSTKKWDIAYKVQSNKLYKYSTSTKKYTKVGSVSTSGGKLVCKLTKLNLKSAKSMKFKVRAVVTKSGYKTAYGAYGKTVTLK